MCCRPQCTRGGGGLLWLPQSSDVAMFFHEYSIYGHNLSQALIETNQSL